MSESLRHLDDQYEILAPMREGGMGAIYKVRHRLLDQIRVVKVLHSKLSDDDEFQERFAREARLATRVHHPNIAQVFDFSIKGGTAFLVMEFIDGVNFSQLIQQEGLPPLDLTLEISAQALLALGHLHKHQMVHRDISPDNLMLARDDEDRPVVKLIDLGIAKPLQEDTTLTKTGLFMGKLHYASPEQFGRKEEGIELDHRSDIYSYGVVLYQLLTGELPFSGSESSVIAGHLFHPPAAFEQVDAPGRVSPPLRQAVLKALEKKPEDRFQSAAEFGQALASLQSGDEEETRQQPTPIQVEAPPDTGSARLEAGQLKRLLAGAERLAQLEQYTEARVQLETLLAIDPENESAEGLLRRIVDSQLAPLVGEASRLLLSKAFADALEKLEEAKEIAPTNESVVRMLEEATAGLEEERREKEMHKRLGALRELVAEALEADRPEDAEARLAESRELLGEAEEFTALEGKVTRAARAKRERRVRELSEKAATASRKKEYQAAIDLLEDAEQLDSDNAGIRRQLEEARLGLEVEQHRRMVAFHLEAGRLSQAERALQQAREEVGELPLLEGLGAEIEKHREIAVEKGLTDVEAEIAAGELAVAEELLTETRAIAGREGELAERVEAVEVRMRTLIEAKRALEKLRGRLDRLIEEERFEDALGVFEEAAESTELPTEWEEFEKRLRKSAAAQAEIREKKALEEVRATVLDSLDKSEFAQARLDLARALRRFPKEPSILELQEKLESLEAAEAARLQDEEQRQRAGRLAEEAEAALEAGRSTRVGPLVEELREIGTDHAEQLAAGIEARLAELEERASLLEAADQALGDEDLEAARDKVRQTLEISPSDPEIQKLLRSIEEKIAEKDEGAETAEAVRRLLEAATRSEADGRLVEAEEALSEALELEPGDAQLASRLETLRGRIEQERRQAEERAAAEAASARVDELVHEAGQLAEKGAYSEALERLGEARAFKAPAEVIEVLESKVREKLAAEEREKEIDEKLALASAALARGSLDDADGYVAEVLELAKGHERAGELRTEIEAERETRRREAERLERVEAALATARAALTERCYDDAAGALDEAEALEAEPGELAKLRGRVEKGRAARRQAEEAARQAAALADAEEADEATVDEDGAVGARAAASETAVEEADAELPPTVDEPSPVRATPRVESRQVEPRPVETSGVETGLEAPAWDVERPDSVPAAEPVASPTPWWRQRAAIGGAAALVLAAIAWMLIPTGGPNPVPRGRFVLDATPWARLVSIETLEGEAVSSEGADYTPIVLELEPGTYRVGLSHPSRPEVHFEQIEVTAEGGGEKVVLLQEVDLDAYFEAAGWNGD